MDSDTLATREEASYMLGLDLEDKKTNNNIKALQRQDEVQRLFTKLVRGFMVLAFILLALGVSTLALHLVLPETCRWLSDDDFTRLKDAMFSGSVGAGLAALGKNTFKMNKMPD